MNAASYAQPGVLAPGMIFSIFGSRISDGGTAVATGGFLPTQLAGTRVLVNGIPAPLFYVSPGQINAQFPVEAAGLTTARVQVEVQTSSGTVASPAFSGAVAPFSPGIFTLNQNGSGPGAILRAGDFSPICPAGRSDCSSNAASPGEAVSIYMTGLGQVSDPWASGQLAPQASSTTTVPAVTIGGVPAEVSFSGLAPGLVGIYQINVVIPPVAPGRNTVPLVVSTGGVFSNTVSLSVNSPAIPVDGLPELTLTNEDGPDPVRSSDTLTYTITVQNQGTKAAENVVLKDTLSAGVSFTACQLSSGSCSATSGIVTALLGTLQPADSVRITITASVTSTATPVFLTNVANVSTTSLESNSANNEAVLETTANALSTLNGGLPGFDVLAIAVDPVRDGTVYAGTRTAGVFKSTNHGASWTTVNSGLSSMEVNTLALNPQVPATLYAGTSAGLFKSTAGGINWSPPQSDAARATIRTIVVDPANPAVLYAGTAFGRVLRSVDGGETWQSTAPQGGGTAVAILLRPTQPTVLYAGLQFINVGFPSSGGVVNSADGGASWNPLNSGLPQIMWAAHGQTGTLPNTVPCLAIDPANPQILYACTSSGIFKTENQGRNWVLLTSDIVPRTLAFAVGTNHQSTVYAGTGGGVFRSIDGGVTWTAASMGLPSSLEINALVIDPSDPSIIYVGTNGFGFFRSVDGGSRWVSYSPDF